jgi:hypothetical protein
VCFDGGGDGNGVDDSDSDDNGNGDSDGNGNGNCNCDDVLYCRTHLHRMWIRIAFATLCCYAIVPHGCM